MSSVDDPATMGEGRAADLTGANGLGGHPTTPGRPRGSAEPGRTRRFTHVIGRRIYPSPTPLDPDQDQEVT